MNNVQLQRTLRLLRRTGDRGIVLDTESDEIFVLMDADAYEQMLPSRKNTKNPTAGTDALDIDEDYVLDDLLDIEESKKSGLTEKNFESSGEKSTFNLTKDEKLSFTEDWAEKKSAVLSEESLSDVPHEEEEEEKFYLEPVE